jgi:hypothetical protein
MQALGKPLPLTAGTSSFSLLPCSNGYTWTTAKCDFDDFK